MIDRSAVEYLIGALRYWDAYTEEQRNDIIKKSRSKFRGQIEEAWEHGCSKTKPEETDFGLDSVPCEDGYDYYSTTFDIV